MGDTPPSSPRDAHSPDSAAAAAVAADDTAEAIVARAARRHVNARPLPFRALRHRRTAHRFTHLQRSAIYNLMLKGTRPVARLRGKARQRSRLLPLKLARSCVPIVREWTVRVCEALSTHAVVYAEHAQRHTLTHHDVEHAARQLLGRWFL